MVMVRNIAECNCNDFMKAWTITFQYPISLSFYWLCVVVGGVIVVSMTEFNGPTVHPDICI